MVSVIILWIYVLATVFLMGYGCMAISKKIFHYQIKSILSILMAGVAAATVYAQVFSLFAGVSLAANVLMVFFCAVIALLGRKDIYSLLKKQIQDAGTAAMVTYAVLFLLMSYGASRGIMHYDTALYHAQSIRWIEEYGAVKGLGNLHCRLAYNSASFALSALYSMRFVTGQPFHVMAGFVALLLSFECVQLIRVKERGRLLLSDYARVAAVYYLLIIFDEMVSPASDYFMVTTAFYIVIRFLTLLEQGESEPEGYGMLCLLGVYLLTVKLSAAFILLLVIKPACMLVSQKKWKETAAFMGAGLCAALPYFIRNVLISGWLIYPFTAVDLFSVDWKLPRGLAEYDAREIQVWGRGYRDVLQYDLPMKKWIGSWFAQQSGLDRLWIAAALAAVVIVLLKMILFVAAYSKNRTEAAHAYRFMIVEATLAAGFLFWLCSSPLIRYGCVYVYLTAAVVWGNVLEHLSGRMFRVRKAAYLLLILFGCYKLVMFGKENVLAFQNAYWVCQKAYENHPVKAYEVEGLTFYCAEEGDQTGYEPFPSAPARADILLRGRDYADGFRAAASE